MSTVSRLGPVVILLVEVEELFWSSLHRTDTCLGHWTWCNVVDNDLKPTQVELSKLGMRKTEL